MACRRLFIGSVGLLAWLGISGSAHADIPFADQTTPGELRGVALTAGSQWNLGYWEYLPSNFESLGADEELPLLVFLAGIGEFDNPSACPGGADLCTPQSCNGDGLCRNLTWGPQQLMADDEWDDTDRPFIMISPQNLATTFTATEWNAQELDEFLQFIVDNYPVDERRMYLIGMSQGGRAVLQYTGAYPRRFTAVAPAPGGGTTQDLPCHFQDTGLWVFHGEDDQDGNLGPGVFDPCFMVERTYMYNNPDEYPDLPACVDRVGDPYPTARVTMFDNVQHSSWIQTVDPIGSGFVTSSWSADEGCNIDVTFRQYTAANDPDGVYSWFLSLDRPDVIAPDDLEVAHDAAPVQLAATVVDDDTVSYTWTQTAGDPVTLADDSTATLSVSDFDPEQSYTFEVLVVDADNQWDIDEVTMTVAAEPAGSTGGEGTGSTGESSDSGDTDSDGDTGSPTTGMVSTSGDGTASGDPSGGSNTTGDSTSGGPATAGPGSGGQSGGTDGTASGTDTDGGDTDGSGLDDDDGASGCSCSSAPDGSGLTMLPLLGLLVLRRRS